MQQPTGYLAAPLELAAASASGHHCEVARRAIRTDDMWHWLEYVHAAGGPTARQPSKKERAAFSRISWRNGCDELIEPLTGVARHPLSIQFPCKLKADLENVSSTRLKALMVQDRIRPHSKKDQASSKYHIGHLLTTNWCAPRGRCMHDVPRPRALLFDLGCGKFGRLANESERAANETETRTVSQGYGSSIPLLFAMASRNCITFDQVYAWEAREGRFFHPSQWSKQVPSNLRSRVTYFNEPVNLSRTSFFGVLEAAARPEDYVVLKVDIDTPWLEKRIIETVSAEPALAARVDELFFEYHLKLDDGTRVPKAWEQFFSKDTIAEGIGLMQRLRRQGIRSHWWV